jgi:DNA polymerase epsilon subunit 1
LLSADVTQHDYSLRAVAGVFKAWILVEARLYAVPLRVPRTFYVNSTLAPDDPDSPALTMGGLKVTRTVPFGREAFHLYQVRPRARMCSAGLSEHQASSTASIVSNQTSFLFCT